MKNLFDLSKDAKVAVLSCEYKAVATAVDNKFNEIYAKDGEWVNFRTVVFNDIERVRTWGAEFRSAELTAALETIKSADDVINLIPASHLDNGVPFKVGKVVNPEAPKMTINPKTGMPDIDKDWLKSRNEGKEDKDKWTPTVDGKVFPTNWNMKNFKNYLKSIYIPRGKALKALDEEALNARLRTI